MGHLGWEVDLPESKPQGPLSWGVLGCPGPNPVPFRTHSASRAFLSCEEVDSFKLDRLSIKEIQNSQTACPPYTYNKFLKNFCKGELGQKCPHPRREFQRHHTSLQVSLTARRCFLNPLCLISDVHKLIHRSNFTPPGEYIKNHSKQLMWICSSSLILNSL